MKKQSGFTLIELLLVLAIIGIIAAIAIPALLGQRDNARNKATESNASNVAGAIQNALGISEDVVDGSRLPTDLNGANTAAAVLAVVSGRSEYLLMKNPFNRSAAAYAFGGAAGTMGEVGIEASTLNGVKVAKITFGLKNASGGTTVKTLPKLPETSLP